MNQDAWYQDLLGSLLGGGLPICTRNADVHRRIDLAPALFRRLPLLTLRKVPWKTALRELEWLLTGSNRLADAHPTVHPWWQPWVNARGEIANHYGRQLRSFAGMVDYEFDQIDYLVKGVRDHPYSRRNVITTWNTADMASPATPITNCWWTTLQAFVEPDGGLCLVTYQRSADVMCGLPANLVQLWAFLLWLAHRTGHKPGWVRWIGGDVHLYRQHEELARELAGLGRHPDFLSPELLYSPSSERFLADDFSLSGDYRYVLDRKAEMVV